MSETDPHQDTSAAEVLGSFHRAIASTVDQTQTQDVFTSLGLGLWYARMTEQLVRTLAVGLKLEPDESLGDAAGQLTRGPWDEAEKALLAHWPEEVQMPEALTDRLAAVRHFRNNRLAHGLCDELTRVIFDPNAADELLRELNGFISSCQQLQQELVGHLVGHLAARRAIDTTQAAQAAGVFIGGLAGSPTDFRDVSLSDADQWASHLLELISEQHPAMAAALRSMANEGQQGKDRPDN